MKKSTTIPFARTAILTLAEIKAAVAAFDRGEENVATVLDAIVAAVEAYRRSEKRVRKAA